MLFSAGPVLKPTMGERLAHFLRRWLTPFRWLIYGPAPTRRWVVTETPDGVADEMVMIDFKAALDWPRRFTCREDFEAFVDTMARLNGWLPIHGPTGIRPLYISHEETGMEAFLKLKPSDRCAIHLGSSTPGAERRISVAMTRSHQGAPSIVIRGRLPHQDDNAAVHWRRLAEELIERTRPLTRWNRYFLTPLVTSESRESYTKTTREKVIRWQSWGLGVAGGLIGAFILKWLGIK